MGNICDESLPLNFFLKSLKVRKAFFKLKQVKLFPYFPEQCCADLMQLVMRFQVISYFGYHLLQWEITTKSIL